MQVFLLGNLSESSPQDAESVRFHVRADEKSGDFSSCLYFGGGVRLYSKVDTNLNFVDREKEVLDFWKKNNIAQKAIDQREGCDTFTFYDGPPTANGKPHIGHVLTRVIKDMLPRYQSMKGKKVLRKAGWDTHGLPVELEVEKLVGINGKEQIEEYGIEPFIKKCRESVWKYKGMWEEFSDVVGFWADMEHPYITYENDFIESEWWALKEIWTARAAAPRCLLTK